MGNVSASSYCSFKVDDWLWKLARYSLYPWSWSWISKRATQSSWWLSTCCRDVDEKQCRKTCSKS